MTKNKSLPDNPSLDHERKQAKALVKAVACEDAEAIARVRGQLPECELPISLRVAQLVIAREYGFSGWSDLKAAILEPSERSLEVVFRQACEAIDANDVQRLNELITEHPRLLTYRRSQWPEVLLQQTTSYANFPGADNEEHYNRPQCAELLLDAGAIVDPRVYLRLIDTGAHQMLALFDRKDVLPQNLRVVTALGDLRQVAACFDDNGELKPSGRPSVDLLGSYAGAENDWPDPQHDYAIVADAFLYACRLSHRDIAAWLLERCTQFDTDLAVRIEKWQGPAAFIDFLIARSPEGARHGLTSAVMPNEPGIIWQRAVELRLLQAQEDGDVDTFRELLLAERFLLDQGFIDTQVRILEVASYSDDARDIIATLLDSEAAIVTADPPPASPAISHAIEYGHTDYVPLLSRIWPVPDDLPHAAGLGDMPNVAKWFADDSPSIKPDRHNLFLDHFPGDSVQDVLDRGLAWAVINGHYAIADFLLDHGADINTRWSTHEPASILHECAWTGRLEQIKYLIAKGIDLTILDHRHQSTAEGWAHFCGQTAAAEFLAAAKKNAAE